MPKYHTRVIVGYDESAKPTSWTVIVQQPDGFVAPPAFTEEWLADVSADDVVKRANGSTILVVRPGCPLFDRLVDTVIAFRVDMTEDPLRVRTGEQLSPGSTT